MSTQHPAERAMLDALIDVTSSHLPRLPEGSHLRGPLLRLNRKLTDIAGEAPPTLHREPNDERARGELKWLRTEPMERVIRYMDGLQGGTDETSVSLEISITMLERLADQLGFRGRRHAEDAIDDAVNDGHLHYFHWPAKILTTEGEIETRSRDSILWMDALGIIDRSDPREG